MIENARLLTLPTDPPQRIHSLDILRGFALFGMFVVHFHERSSDPGGFDEVIRTLIWRLARSLTYGHMQPMRCAARVPEETMV